jgi:hypothetical protein
LIASALASFIDETRRLLPETSRLLSIRLPKPGNAKEAMIARITIVMSSSINVKPAGFRDTMMHLVEKLYHNESRQERRPHLEFDERF